MPRAVLSVSLVMVSLVRMSVSQFTRDSLYHAMNDRGVYLPDDYNSDLPPAQVTVVPPHGVSNLISGSSSTCRHEDESPADRQG